jgi:hypothetical protein
MEARRNSCRIDSSTLERPAQFVPPQALVAFA